MRQPATAAAPAAAPALLPVDLGPLPAPARGIGRIPVTKVEPVIEGGVYAAKAVVGEAVPIRAKVFREGHDAVNASVILTDPHGRETRHDMTPLEPRGLDPWEAWVRPDSEGLWRFRVEGWSDPWATWLHNAQVKLPAGVDVPLVCLEGRDLLERTAAVAQAAGDPVQASILSATALLLIPERPAEDLVDVASAHGLAKAMKESQVTGGGQRPSGQVVHLSPKSGMSPAAKQTPFLSSTTTKKAATVEARSYAWGGRLTNGAMKQAGLDAATRKRYAGMVKMDTSTPGGAKSSAYMTFRIMMEGSKGWVVPAQPGRYIAKKVAEDLQTKAEAAFAAADKSIIK